MYDMPFGSSGAVPIFILDARNLAGFGFSVFAASLPRWLKSHHLVIADLANEYAEKVLHELRSLYTFMRFSSGHASTTELVGRSRNDLPRW